VATVVDLHDVWFSWPGGRHVLEAVSFSLEEGAFVSVVGPNGGGKTTLLKLLLGLLEPDRGRIRVLGETPVQARSRIGYMPQHATVDPRFPVHVLDVVSMGLLGPRPRLGGHSAADRAAARAALARVGLDGLERRPFSNLSGGQRQRALIARALVSDPELLLLDEPEAGLDRKQDLYDLLGELNRDATVVVVSHDLGLVSHLVETVVCVRGRVEVHPTAALDGVTVRELYGRDMQLVQHDHGA
jgi:zinc transport system ATP-binding protein